MNFINPAAVGALAVPSIAPTVPFQPDVAVGLASVEYAADDAVEGVDDAVEGADDVIEGTVIANDAVDGAVVADDAVDNGIVIRNYIIEGLNTSPEPVRRHAQ